MAKKSKPEVKTEAPKVGRPKKEVDLAMLEKLCMVQAPPKVIADILGIHPDTLRDNYSTEMEHFQSKGKGKIAFTMWDLAINKEDTNMLKMLAQKHLDYSDKVKTENEVKHTYENLSDEELELRTQEALKKLKGGE